MPARGFLSQPLVVLLSVIGATSSARSDDKPNPAVVAPDHAKAMAKGTELFKTSVRQVLIARCLKCHGGESTKGEFDLSTREAMLKEGTQGPNVVPGKSAESRLAAMLDGKEKPRMPYKTEALAPSEIGAIKQWIDLGAPFDQPLVEAKAAADRSKVTPEARRFWSFRPLTSPTPPTLKDASRVKTQIDRFILAKLEANKLGFTPEADRRVLIRRVYLDLVGLPPTPAEIDAFLKDTSADAYEKLVDRLLNNPHHGERWARHWLDLARFAESHGYEQDYDRPHAYHYRDFVIRAFNDDMPFDRFVRLQIAGDELEPTNPEALRATGYLGCGTHATQITANQVEKERYDELDDMAANIGTTMLGLTIGCARCHDHKYDPIPMRDYYRMISTFTTTVRSEIDVDVDPVKTLQAKARYDADHFLLVAPRTKYEKEVLPGKLEAFLKSGGVPPMPRWLILEPESAASAGGATFEKKPDGSYLATGKNPKNDAYTFVVKPPAAGSLTSLRVEALADPSLVKGGPGRAANGNFALTRLTVTKQVGGGKPVELKLIHPRADFEQKGLPVAASIDEDKNSAWAVDPQFGKNHAAVYDFEKPVELEAGATLTVTMRFDNNDKHAIGRPRLSASLDPVKPEIDGDSEPFSKAIAFRTAAKTPADKRSKEQNAALLERFKSLDPEWRKLNDAVVAHEKTEPKPALVKMQVTSEGFPAIRFHTQGGDYFEKTYFLKRGDLAQKQGEADSGFLQVLETAPEGEKRWKVDPPKQWRTSYRRTGLANWLTDVNGGAGHLLARVIVNRLWQHHLGRGIVNTPSDFGASGDRPSHPELLDYLASELIKGGWRLRPIHKLIMTSAVYRQSVSSDPERLRVDRDGSLYSRRLYQRLEAEVIRDTMLALSGRMEEKQFGAGSLDEGQSRRSIYYTIKRSQLIPLMILFDAPDSLAGIGNRPATTIAPQALALLNNKYIRGYASGFAERLVPTARQSASDAVKSAYREALGRDPAPGELVDSLDFLFAQAERYRSEGRSDALHPAMTDFCQSIMCLNEFVYVE